MRGCPLVSVITPTRDRARLTLEAIASIQAQTYPAVEIIVVDDGSTDETAELLDGLEGITFIAQEHSGSAAARTRGLAAASGEYIASLDSDDFWHPTFLERSVGALEAAELDFVFSNWLRAPATPSYLDQLAGSGDLTRFQTDVRDGWAVMEPDQVRTMFIRSCTAPSSALVMRRTSMPSGWNAAMEIADDWYLILEMVLRRPCRGAFTLAPLWTKRVLGGNQYDGRDSADITRSLYVHDLGHFRRDFAEDLRAGERTALAMRHMAWHARLAYLTLRGASVSP